MLDGDTWPGGLVSRREICGGLRDAYQWTSWLRTIAFVVRGRREMKLLVEVAPCLPVRLRCGAGGLSQACQLAEACNYSGFETTFGDTYRPKPVPHYWNSPVSSHTPSTSVPRLFSAVSVVRSSFQLRDTNVARHLLCWPSGHGTHARFP